MKYHPDQIGPVSSFLAQELSQVAKLVFCLVVEEEFLEQKGKKVFQA